jgi:ABC-2 type transport system permease protein
MKSLRLGAKIVSTIFRQSTYQLDWAIADAISLAVRCGLLLALYHYTFQVKGGTIAGQQYPVVAWSMFMYFIFMTLRLRNLDSLINQDIQSGNVEMFFNKPISYLVYRMWYQIGAGSASVVILAPLGIITMIAFVAAPAILTTGFFWLTLPMVVLGCTILSLLIYAIIGLTAFWIEDSTPVHWIVDKLIMILGGSYLPIAFFPPLMKSIAIYSPFGACQFITSMTADSWNTDAWKLIGIQWAWILVLMVGMIVMYKQARLKLSVNGG